MKKKKQFREKILLLCVSIVLALIVFEGFLSFFYPQTINVYTYDEDYLFAFRPFSQIDYTSTEFKRIAKFNSEGFRDIEHDYFQKSPDVQRIMFLGDSFVAGLEVGMNDTFVSRIREAFSDVEVINAGTSGWSTEQELLFLEKRGLAYNPDVVTLVYFIGNDQIDNVGRPLFLYDGEELAFNTKRPLSQSRLRSVYYTISSYYHTYNFFLILYWNIRELFSKPYGFDYDDAFVQYMQPIDPPDVARSWDKTLLLLDKIHDLLSEKNIPLVLVLVPEQIQESSELRKERGLDDKELVIDKPQSILKEYAESRDIPIIDLLPAFQDPDEPLHFEKDLHWNVAGHALAAEEITTFLKTNLTLSADGKQ